MDIRLSLATTRWMTNLYSMPIGVSSAWGATIVGANVWIMKVGVTVPRSVGVGVSGTWSREMDGVRNPVSFENAAIVILGDCPRIPNNRSP